MADRIYFATKQGKDFCTSAFEKIEDYYNYLRYTRRLELMRRVRNSYNMGSYRAGQLIPGGDQNEFTLMCVNHFRNILNHQQTMTVTSRPAFEPRATNTDYKSKAQCIVARGILDYYNREKGMGDSGDNATKVMTQYGESEVVLEWDPVAGKDYMADPEKPGTTIKDGDVTFTLFGPIDCIRDITLTSATQMTWRIYRKFGNRYDLAARFPEARDRIMRVDIDNSVMSQRWLMAWTNDSGDTIPYYIFYHDVTPAMPQGRYTLFIDNEGPLMDTALPYGFFPGCRMAAEEEDGTPFGYSIAFDLLPIQEAIDILYSTVITNQANFGVQNILIPTGANLTVQQLIDGLNALYYDPKNGKPEALNLTSTPAEIFNMIERLENVMEILSGINSTTRGEPEANLKSGAALALVQSMAIQFNSALQKAYNKLIEAMGTGLIKILAKFPKTPRLIEIAGKSNRTYMKQFTADDLVNISRVTVDLGNPLSRTTAGKIQMAEDLLSNKLIDTSDQYVQVLTTGQLEPLIEGKQAELMLIASENDMMSAGEKPIVAVTDDHALHVREHKSVLASPEARVDPKAVQAVTAHLTEHINILQTLSVSNPNLLIALGQTPMLPPPPAQLAAPGGGPSATPGKIADPTSPVVKVAENVNLPSMPTNPLDGQKAPAPLPSVAA